jgi:GDP-L-fucose synthase
MNDILGANTENSLLSIRSQILVLGHRGMVGSAIIRKLESEGFTNIITRPHSELDLTNQQAVRAFFTGQQIDYVVLAAARVGGIHANNIYPAEFIYQNMMIEANVIHEAYSAGVRNLLFLGSSCVYPKFASQPIRESELLNGILEPTNELYAIAKIAGIKLCESYNRQYGTDYRSLMPTNLYGPNDNFHPQNSHVIPALVRRIHEAKVNGDAVVTIWGTGNARREFLHVDDMAAACLHVMQLSAEKYAKHTEPMLSQINVGTGEELSIRQLAKTIQHVVGFHGELIFDANKSDGTPKKRLDVSRINKLGWHATVKLEEGLREIYTWFLSHQDDYRS